MVRNVREQRVLEQHLLLLDNRLSLCVLSNAGFYFYHCITGSVWRCCGVYARGATKTQQ